MCRIAGFWDFNYRDDYDITEVATNMRDTLIHGGPDDAGNYIEVENGLALSHRRLSIIDLSDLAHQPMISENKEVIISYNGEVYNFQEIKKELEGLGITFKSTSDTEVILKAYIKWGFDFIHKCRGMWAFAIWDEREEKIILCRDRVGVKPLYWYLQEGIFMFSSELKAFHKHPKFKKDLWPEALSLYLQYGYISSPYSIFKHTYKLEPGHFLTINKNGDIKKDKYWEAEDFYHDTAATNSFNKKTENEIEEELEDILRDSFKLRMVADVPVGMFLSGGIDSSLVTAILQKEYTTPLKTFTIGFHEKQYNEAQWAKKVSAHLGTDHTELYCTAKDAFDIIKDIPQLYDEQFGDSSAIPTHLVSRLAKEQVKVSLSADGGDEQFCGYKRYWYSDKLIKTLNNIPLSNHFPKALSLVSPDLAFSIITPLLDKFKPSLKRSVYKDKYIKLLMFLEEKDHFKKYDIITKFFLTDDLLLLDHQKDITQTYKVEHQNGLDNISLYMLYDLKSYLPDDLLVKVDRATMGVALEGREPFLDHKIIEYAARLPMEYKYKNNTSKYILRKILYKHVPRELIDRPKQGFAIPLYEWFRNELKELYLEYLNPERIKNEGIFDSKEVEKLLNDFLNDKGISPFKLWYLFVFQVWKEKYL